MNRSFQPFSGAAAVFVTIFFCSLERLPAADPESPPATKSEKDGREIAMELCRRAPARSDTTTGRFQFRDAKNKRSQVRATFSTEVSSSGWENLYRTASTNAGDAAHVAKLLVIHRIDQPVEYRLYRDASSDSKEGEYQTLKGNAAMIPFAASDFWLADLGLEFLHWPDQKLLKKEMRRGESCFVLESTNPEPQAGTYRKVKSWIHMESGGIVEAEAYGYDGKLLKEFEPDSFKKVDGKYELKSMKMVNEQTDTKTSIEFDLAVK